MKREKGKIDILFASAGIGEPVPLGQITEEHFDRTFDLNVRGTLFTVQKALPLFNGAAEKITEMRVEGVELIGASAGVIESLDARRTGAKTRSLRLIPHEGMLVCRILATDPRTAMLPYVLSLNRAPA